MISKTKHFQFIWIFVASCSYFSSSTFLQTFLQQLRTPISTPNFPSESKIICYTLYCCHFIAELIPMISFWKYCMCTDFHRYDNEVTNMKTKTLLIDAAATSPHVMVQNIPHIIFRSLKAWTSGIVEREGLCRESSACNLYVYLCSSVAIIRRLMESRYSIYP